jgi:uncharacterized membrane protein YdjX (TVP38/TMEM64 family)
MFNLLPVFTIYYRFSIGMTVCLPGMIIVMVCGAIFGFIGGLVLSWVGFGVLGR